MAVLGDTALVLGLTGSGDNKLIGTNGKGLGVKAQEVGMKQQPQLTKRTDRTRGTDVFMVIMMDLEEEGTE